MDFINQSSSSTVSPGEALRSRSVGLAGSPDAWAPPAVRTFQPMYLLDNGGPLNSSSPPQTTPFTRRPFSPVDFNASSLGTAVPPGVGVCNSATTPPRVNYASTTANLSIASVVPSHKSGMNQLLNNSLNNISKVLVS